MRPGERAFLQSYDPAAYPPFALTVDLCLFTLRHDRLCVLLVQRAEHPYRGFWALPGGHVEHGRESAEQAAVRELCEETGLQWKGHLEQLRTYSTPDRDPRIAAGLHVASVAFVALAPGLPEPSAGSDASAARWWAVDEVDLSALGYDHAAILTDGLERTRAKLEYTTLATSFVAEPFSLNDLRRVYTAVWGAAPDLAVFRRKVLGTDGFVIPVTVGSGQGGRPSQLYRRGSAELLHPAMLRP